MARDKQYRNVNKIADNMASNTAADMGIVDSFISISYAAVDNALLPIADILKSKCVYCPCDDPRFSTVWKYLHTNFTKLGLNKLIATFKTKDNSSSFVIIYYGGNDGDCCVGSVKPLIANGDFITTELKQFFDECDIIITNPPYNRYEEFVDYLKSFKKEYILVGYRPSIHLRDFVVDS